MHTILSLAHYENEIVFQSPMSTCVRRSCSPNRGIIFPVVGGSYRVFRWFFENKLYWPHCIAYLTLRNCLEPRNNNNKTFLFLHYLVM
jgi:hypothetical protein